VEANNMEIINYKNLTKEFFSFISLEDNKVVKEILKEIELFGDKAVRKYAYKFDKITTKNFEISKKEIAEAYKNVNKETMRSLKKAVANINLFAVNQLQQLKNFELNISGNIVGQKVIPIEKVGCYVPGGRYPLPSTALMTILPAKIAGVKEIIVCSPKIKPETIVAADLAGANKIFNIGGVQAIGAMAYGTASVPKVDKIVGPGNVYVMKAKKEVYGTVGIDFIAGPSEIMIIADDYGDEKLIAADLLAQAEHDPNSRCDLLTTSEKLALNVKKEIKKQLKNLKTRKIAQQSINRGRIVIVNNLNRAVEIANKKAPEHLELQVKDSEEIINKLYNYGSLFIGKYSAEVFGDYCSGANHTLPTNGAARYTGGLSVRNFLKIVTFQNCSKEGAQKLSSIATCLANIEGLSAHKKSAALRSVKNYIKDEIIRGNTK
jgi:histidinol dehydrogenase